MRRMRSRRFRLGLTVAVLVGLASCEINPQPGLPNEPRPSLPGSDAGGSLNLGEGTAGTTSGPSAGGTNNDTDTANGGSLMIGLGGEAPSGAGGAGPETPGEGGAGGETDAGGAGGAGGAVSARGPK
jgi:hypothetical protein